QQKELLRQKMDGIAARLKKGEDFAALAKQFSQDPGSAARGGELAVFQHGEMVPAFENAAYALKPGELSGVVESPFGYHVIKLEERLPAEKQSFDSVKDKLRRFVAEKNRNAKVEGFISQLWARARIETYL